ncbi:MAG: hypothetical protein ACI4NP_04300 [Thermoguttaceae bacterium]
MGNVYDITGKLVGQTDKASKKLEKEAAEAAKKAALEMEKLKRAAQKTANELNEIGDKLDIATGQLGALGGNLRVLGGALENDSLSRIGNIIDVLFNTQAAIANVKSVESENDGQSAKDRPRLARRESCCCDSGIIVYSILLST